jgi:hypothetical protein
MSEKQTFEVLLEKRENMETTYIEIPFDVEKVLGAKRVPVKISVMRKTIDELLKKKNQCEIRIYGGLLLNKSSFNCLEIPKIFNFF